MGDARSPLERDATAKFGAFYGAQAGEGGESDVPFVG